MSRISKIVATGIVCGLLTGAAGAQGPAVTRVYDASTDGIVLPTVVSRENPTYTRAALDAGLAGDTSVDVTVDVDGRVRDVLLVKSVDAVHGLDEAAVAAAGRWVFTPATLDGRAVPVRVRLAMSFKAR
jgi:TonB family protein